MKEFGMPGRTSQEDTPNFWSLTPEGCVLWMGTDPDGYFAEAEQTARKEVRAKIERKTSRRLGRPVRLEDEDRAPEPKALPDAEKDFRTLTGGEKIVWMRTNPDGFVKAADAAREPRQLTQQFLRSRSPNTQKNK
jgi:hypothetical protein